MRWDNGYDTDRVFLGGKISICHAFVSVCVQASVSEQPGKCISSGVRAQLCGNYLRLPPDHCLIQCIRCSKAALKDTLQMLWMSFEVIVNGSHTMSINEHFNVKMLSVTFYWYFVSKYVTMFTFCWFTNTKVSMELPLWKLHPLALIGSCSRISLSKQETRRNSTPCSFCVSGPGSVQSPPKMFCYIVGLVGPTRLQKSLWWI